MFVEPGSPCAKSCGTHQMRIENSNSNILPSALKPFGSYPAINQVLYEQTNKAD
jgi:hypothetical protein